jgi:hypothetical protein
VKPTHSAAPRYEVERYVKVWVVRSLVLSTPVTSTAGAAPPNGGGTEGGGNGGPGGPRRFTISRGR